MMVCRTSPAADLLAGAAGQAVHARGQGRQVVGLLPGSWPATSPRPGRPWTGPAPGGRSLPGRPGCPAASRAAHRCSSPASSCAPHRRNRPSPGCGRAPSRLAARTAGCPPPPGSGQATRPPQAIRATGPGRCPAARLAGGAAAPIWPRSCGARLAPRTRRGRPGRDPSAPRCRPAVASRGAAELGVAEPGVAGGPPWLNRHTGRAAAAIVRSGPVPGRGRAVLPGARVQGSRAGGGSAGRAGPGAASQARPACLARMPPPRPSRRCLPVIPNAGALPPVPAA